jgi:RNA-binding protein
MTELTGKQKSFLRSLAMTRPAVFRIGKEGVTPAFIDAVDSYLLKNELVKIAILPTASVTRDDLVTSFASQGALPVQTIGRNIVLYRANPRLERPIVLPRP